MTTRIRAPRPDSLVLRGAGVLIVAELIAAACAGAGPASPTAVPSAWRPVADQASFAGGELLAVTRSPSLIVGVGRVGDNGGLWTSADGMTWNATTAGSFTGVEISGVTFADGTFVAVGSRVGAGAAEGNFEAWSSTDGATWRPSPEGQAVFAARGVAAGGPGFVGVGSALQDVTSGTYAARVATSPDGRGWTAIEDAAFDGARMDGVAAANDVIVGVGSTSGVTPGGAVAWSSGDGMTWTRAPDSPAFADAAMSGVAAGPGGFVAVGTTPAGGAAVWISPDGKAWNRVPDSPAFAGARMQSIAAAGPGYVAVGWGPEDAAVWTSADGMAWIRDPGGEGFAGAQMFGIVGGSPIVIVGRGVPSSGAKALVWTSP